MRPSSSAPMRPGLVSEALRAAAIAGLFATLGGCYAVEKTAVAPPPSDYRLRHPIAVHEGDHGVEVFVGTSRGGLTPAQRADVLAFAHRWKREATGGVVIDLPAGTGNARAAADTLHEIQAILAAAGVPPQGVAVNPYRPADPGKLATIRLSYPTIVAVAGPCGLWPHDLGPNLENPDYFANRPYWNLGCANQRNLAAMVENPADLVQPRGESPAYTGRRTTVLDKYRKGEPTTATSLDDGKGKISDVGK